MADKPAKKPKASEGESQLRVHMLKSPGYREVHADGAFGGVTPKGLIHFSLYSERGPIPREMVYSVEGDTLREHLDMRVSREGIVRQLQVGVYLDVRTAEALRDWLTARIDEVREAQSSGKRKK